MQFKDGTSDEQIRALEDELATLPDKIPSIRSYAFGRDAGLGGNFHFAVVADFDDAAGYSEYADHPEHRKLVDELIVPIRAERAACQFEV
jgi:hypothetical protein